MTDIVERLRDGIISRRVQVEAAYEIVRLRAALGNISRMKVFPDAATNQTTLAAAIGIARAALQKEERNDP